MSNPFVEKDPGLARQALSALMDGEADAQTVLAACEVWRDQPVAREAWHAWHLGGDVLRSENLACAPGRDEAFLARLRARLAEEPVVLSPPPDTSYAQARVAVRRRRRWAGSIAVAAGFVAVAGALVVLRAPSDPGSGPALAQGGAAATSVARVSPPVRVEPQVVVASRQLIRDARLDQYLAAHKQQSVFGVPAGFMLDAPAQAPTR